MTVQLGGPFLRLAEKYGLPEEVIAAIKTDIASDLRAGMKPPTVNVSSPRVSVQAPSVNVQAPAVTVEGPESPEVNVTIPGLEAFAAGLAVIHTDLQALLVLLNQPVTKTVTGRDARGAIETIEEKR